MRFILKQRRFNVMEVDLTISDKGVRTYSVGKIFSPDKLPLQLQSVPPRFMKYEFDAWYKSRLIPSDREDIDRVIRCLSKTPNNVKIDTRATIEIMSLLSYGRNMTDHYWLTPVRPCTIRVGLKGFGLNGAVIEPKRTYKGLDFHKNGIAQDFYHTVRSDVTEVKENVNFGGPDYCTNGSAKKAMLFSHADGNYWLAKYYDNHDPYELASIVNTAISAYEDYPDFFPQAEEIVNDNFMSRGYRTKLFTDSTCDLISLADFCRLKKKHARVNEEVFWEMVDAYGLPKDDLIAMFEAAKDIYNRAGKDINKIFENAGLLIIPESKEIIRPVVWL